MAFGIVAGQSVDLSPIDKKENDWKLILTHTEHETKSTGGTKNIELDGKILSTTLFPKQIRVELLLKGSASYSYFLENSPVEARYSSYSSSTNIVSVSMNFGYGVLPNKDNIYLFSNAISTSCSTTVSRGIQKVVYYSSGYKKSDSSSTEQTVLIELGKNGNSIIIPNDRYHVLNIYNGTTSSSGVNSFDMDITFNLYGKF